MNITLHWPQITLLILMALHTWGKWLNHGKEEKNNAATTFINVPLNLWLLYEGGGFFG